MRVNEPLKPKPIAKRGRAAGDNDGGDYPLIASETGFPFEEYARRVSNEYGYPAMI